MQGQNLVIAGTDAKKTGKKLEQIKFSIDRSLQPLY